MKVFVLAVFFVGVALGVTDTTDWLTEDDLSTLSDCEDSWDCRLTRSWTLYTPEWLDSDQDQQWYDWGISGFAFDGEPQWWWWWGESNWQSPIFGSTAFGRNFPTAGWGFSDPEGDLADICGNYKPTWVHLYTTETVYDTYGRVKINSRIKYSYTPTDSSWADFCSYWSDSTHPQDYLMFPPVERIQLTSVFQNRHYTESVYRYLLDQQCAINVGGSYGSIGYQEGCYSQYGGDKWLSNAFCGVNTDSDIEFVRFGCDSSFAECDTFFWFDGYDENYFDEGKRRSPKQSKKTKERKQAKRDFPNENNLWDWDGYHDMYLFEKYEKDCYIASTYGLSWPAALPVLAGC